MRKLLSVALAALTLAGGALTATGADARPYHGYYGRYYGHGGRGDGALVAGIAGLAIGAAIAGSARPHYAPAYYGGPAYYYGPPAYAYGYGPAYRSCRSFTTWDPYYGGYVRQTRCW